MSDFLLELLSEEIPARMQAKARNDLARLFTEALQAAGLEHGPVTTFSTPRRLALIARDIASSTEAVSEELKGPRTTAPRQALEGFLRKTGLSQDQLEDRDGVWFARIDKLGQGAAAVIADAIRSIITNFPWAKSMRWSDGDVRWVRPLHSIVALLGEEIVPVEIAGIASGAATLGHRFHHPGPITIGGASDYVEKLRACHVIVDQDEREAIIREGAAKAAKKAGLTLFEDEGLVVENAGLTEWPVPLLGQFDPDFLDVPREVIVLTMRTNQKYFACGGDDGALAPAFVCTANIEASDGGKAIVEGNRKVLAARLADARFFWEQDLKVPLEEQAKKLDQIVFHEKLGTVADKVERVAKLARWLVEEGIVTPAKAGAQPSKEKLDSGLRRNDEEVANLADDAERAARLAKADLVTGMVGEFPELQGVIGGYLAEAQGEPKAVADAIRDHYKPVGQGDDVPTAPVTVAVSLADKLDSIAAFFEGRLPPSGSKDPFALRRAALGAIAITLESQISLPLGVALENARAAAAKDALRAEGKKIEAEAKGGVITYPARLGVGRARKGFDGALDEITWALRDFFADRLKVQQREAGVRHDLIDAVFALGGEDDLVRLLARVKALQGFVETEEGTNLLAGYKRAANILKKEGWDTNRHPGLEPGSAWSSTPQEGKRMPDQVRHDGLEPAEAALVTALDAAEPKALSAIEAEDFTAAMAALASLRAPIDAFFDKVTVNADDPGIRARRLNLLARFRDAVNQVADFSKIEG